MTLCVGPRTYFWLYDVENTMRIQPTVTEENEDLVLDDSEITPPPSKRSRTETSSFISRAFSSLDDDDVAVRRWEMIKQYLGIDLFEFAKRWHQNFGHTFTTPLPCQMAFYVV